MLSCSGRWSVRLGLRSMALRSRFQGCAGRCCCDEIDGYVVVWCTVAFTAARTVLTCLRAHDASTHIIPIVTRLSPYLSPHVYTYPTLSTRLLTSSRRWSRLASPRRVARYPTPPPLHPSFLSLRRPQTRLLLVPRM
jgi:hypothetical protein